MDNSDKNIKREDEEEKKVKSETQPNIRKIKIKTLTNQVYNHECNPDILVKDLKIDVEALSQVPRDRQRLVCLGKLLDDNQPLSQYVKEDDTTIHLMAKLAPEQQQSQSQNEQQQQTQQQQQSSQQQQSQRPNPANIFQNMGFANPNVIIRTSVNQSGGQGADGLNQIFSQVSSMLGNMMGGGDNQPRQRPPVQTQSQSQSQQPPQQQPPQTSTNSSQQPSIVQQSVQSEGQQQQQNTSSQQAQSSQQNQQSQSQQQQVPVRSSEQQPTVTILRSSQPPMISSLSQQLLTVQEQLQQQSQQLQLQLQQQQLQAQQLHQQLNNMLQQNQLHQQQNEFIPVQIQLPNTEVGQLGQISNRLMGQNSNFPGPQLPVIQQERNSVQLLGQFLGNFTLQLQRILPFMTRLSDLLQRENLLTDPQSRRQTQYLSNEIGQALNLIQIASSSASGLYGNLQIGLAPGEFRVSDRPVHPINNDLRSQVLHEDHIVSSSRNQDNLGGNGIEQQINSNGSRIPTRPLQTQTSSSQQQQPPQQQNQTNRRVQESINISVQGIQGGDNNIAMIDIESNGDNNTNIQSLLQGLLGQLGGMDNLDEMEQPSQHQNINVSRQQQQQQQPSTTSQQSQSQANDNTNQQQQSRQNNRGNMDIEDQKDSDDEEESKQMSAPIVIQVSSQIISQLNPNFQSNQNQQQGQQHNIQNQTPSSQTQQQPPQQQNSNQAQEQPQQQQPQQAPQIPFNPFQMFQMLGAGGGGGMGNLFGMTLGELIEQNYQEQMGDNDQDILEILGPIKIGDLMQAMLQKNFSFLDGTHDRMRQGLQKIIDKSGSRQKVLESWTKEIGEMFIPLEEQKDLVIEGVECEVIAKEILDNKLNKLFDIIFDDYSQKTIKFSEIVVDELKLLIGQLIYEISEGLINGVTDFEKIFKRKLIIMMQRHFGEQLANLVQMMLLNDMWKNFQKMYEEYKENLEQKEKMNVERNGEEEQLLQEIDSVFQKDQEQFDKYQDMQFSEEYKKGDFNNDTKKN